ncbi:MAG: sugar nucleotide-binding protein, partial [Alphaproteobacteria bacterium]|nr:sugar nucleotide-binding protein [Alphaproteobacteria bacterium]
MAGPVLVVGGDSRIGRALVAHLEGLGIEVRATTRRREAPDERRPYLDLADPTASLDALPAAEAVVLTAAIARLGACEDDPFGSARVNVEGTIRVAEAMAARGAQVLLLSTDKVFDGSRPLRHREDGVSPLTEYGRQKALAEAGIRGLGPRGAILRLSKVLAPEDPLVGEWVTALAAGQPITPFTDMYLAPVPLDLVCRMVARLLAAGEPGIFHLSGGEDRSYADFAARLGERLGAPSGLVRP